MYVTEGEILQHMTQNGTRALTLCHLPTSKGDLWGNLGVGGRLGSGARLGYLRTYYETMSRMSPQLTQSILEPGLCTVQ